MRSLTFVLALLLAGSFAAPSARAADAAPALASLTYSGDQAALVDLDREIVAAGRDAAKLAAIETRLLAILRHKDSTFAARQAICQRLGEILSPASTGALKQLGAMLSDSRDSQLARLALVPVPGADVDKLFLTALGKSSGHTRVGVIESIARRRIEGAVTALTTLLTDPDANTAAAAARALGRIGNPAAVAALRAAKGSANPAIPHALLQATQQLPAAEAQTITRELQDNTALPASLRAASFRRSLDLDPSTALERLAQVLKSSDWTLKQAALEALASSLKPAHLASLAQSLSTWDAPTQCAVIAALARSGETAVVPAVVAATRHADATVRTEALTTLGFLPGSAEVVALLAKTASGDDANAKVARQSLARLSGPDVSAAILAGAESSDTSLRVVLLEQLALRNMTEGIPLLLKCRTAPDASIRAAAVGALGDIASFSEQGALLEWAIVASDETEQTRALRALVSVTLRNTATTTRGQAIYAAIEAAPAEAALRLMPVLARLGGSASAECAARLATRDEPRVSAAAMSALGQWADASALPTFVAIAEKAALPAARSGAIDGALRALERDRAQWKSEHTSLISRLLAATRDTPARQRLASLLARANDREALKLASGLQSDAGLAEEARYAAAAIEAALAGPLQVRAFPAAGAGNAVDGRIDTRWTTPLLGEEWIEVDMQRSRPLRRLTLDQTGRVTEFPERYEVRVFDEPGAPGTVVASGQGQRGRTVIDLPAGTRGRYVRISNVAERTDSSWAVCELHID